MSRGRMPRRFRMLRNRILYGAPHRQTPYQIGRLDYEGAEILLGVTSRQELVRLHACRKEPWTVEWIEGNVGEGAVLYDIGANVGAYSLVAAAVGGPDTRVYAFEPAFATYAALCENVALNGRDDSIVPLPVVLGAQTALDVFAYGDTTAGAARHGASGGSPGFGGRVDGSYRQPVLAYRLDDLVEQFQLAPPTIAKLDVDGAEAAVLAGAQRTFSQPGLQTLLVEIERAREAEVLSAVEGLGLRLVERIDERDGKPLANHWYAIFAR